MPRRAAAAPFVLVLVTAALSVAVEAHDVRVRRPLRVPDVPGFLTLQCDFHTHTVFSDGKVWPDIRSEEAWREGYDAIAITDHVEYQPHRKDLPTNHERSWEIAAPHGEKLGVIVIRGSEITRKMPPGHLNAIFLASVSPLETPEWRDALRAARAQGAFVFWNHPGWRGQQKDGVARWYPEHDEILEAGLLDGIEVINAREYYPEAHAWALEKDLAILASSDIHDPVSLSWNLHEGDHRPVTLVFAKERSEAGLKEALLARRTVAWTGPTLVGPEELVRPLVAAAVLVENPRLSIAAGSEGWVRIRNGSDLRLELTRPGPVEGLTVPADLVIARDGTSLLEIRVPKAAPPGPRRLQLDWTVRNVLVAPGEGLAFPLIVEVEVLPPAP
ncbi:MAG: histidinol-phosphatase [Thermoanaerobaculia bacterium]|nr:histidinol-phosphatase [Thermoanaerobaculia bacterium]